MRRLAVLLAVLAFPPGASAQEPLTPVAPADGAKVQRGEPLEFELHADPAVTQVRIQVRSGGEVLATAGARRDGEVWRAAAHLPRPGVHRWTARAVGPGIDATSAAQRVTVVVPAADARRDPVERRFGRKRNGARLLISTRGIPRGVPRERFGRLVRRTAKRWGLRPGGWTSRRAGRIDGVAVVGFVAPRKLPTGDALAAVRVVRQTRTRNGRVISRRVHDRDMIIRRDLRWWTRRATPDLRSFDLETVLLHEFGHFAGNRGHAGRCSGSPMTESAARGEWWRGPRNWWQAGCANVPT